METATMAQQPGSAQLFGKGAVPEGDAAASSAVDVEGVASQLQAVTIDGSGGEKGLLAEEGEMARGRGLLLSSSSSSSSPGLASTATSTSSSSLLRGAAPRLGGGGGLGASPAPAPGAPTVVVGGGGGDGGRSSSSSLGSGGSGGGAVGAVGVGGRAGRGRGGVGVVDEDEDDDDDEGRAKGGALAGGDEEENEILALLTQEQRAAVDFLSRLQHQHDRLEHEYENELIALKMKYEALYEPLYTQRRNCLLQKDPTNPSADEKGTPAVPRFWLECLKRNSTIADLIEDHDEPVLEYLQNISCEYFTPEEQRKMEQEQEEQQQRSASAAGPDSTTTSTTSTTKAGGVGGSSSSEKGKSSGGTEYPESFRLIFDFAPNPYFTPTRLVKAYHLTTVGGGAGGSSSSNSSSSGGGAGEKAATEQEEGRTGAGEDDNTPPPAGAELTSTRSTEIMWEPGKDVTKKVVTRKQRNKKTRQTRVVQEVVDNESFFNFFTDHDIPTDEKLEAMTDKQVGELQMVVEADYDIGVVIRDRIIPQAVKWFLGEADDDDDQMEDDIDDDDEADSDDLSDSEEDDERPPARGRTKGAWAGRGKGQDW